jgi:hypothetical protein
VTYIPLTIPLRQTLTSIRIGPATRDPDSIARELEQLLSELSMDGVEILKSEIPYRT